MASFHLRAFLEDLRHASRALAKSPGFTAAAAGTLALGIGAAVAIFSLVEASLLRGLPYREPARLVHLWETESRGGRRELSYPDYLTVQESARAFESVAGYTGGSVTLSLPDHAERFRAARVTASFFPTLGVSPASGRAFLPEEAAAGAARVVILSHALWARLFGTDAPLGSRTVVLQDVPHTVVGVLPENFHFAPAEDADVWLPVRPTDQQKARGYWHWLCAIARLAPGVTASSANADAGRVAARIGAADPRFHPGAGFLLRPLSDEIVGSVRPVLLALAAAVACVLLIACANVATLMLGRSARRRKEIAIRIALGATRARLTRFLLAESLLLAAAGGAAGLVLAQWALQWIVAGIPADRRAAMPFLAGLSLGGPVLAFAAAVSLATALACGLAPALRAAGASPLNALKGRLPGSSSFGGRRREPAAWMVALEIALTLVLMTGAGLLARSAARLLAKDTGYDRSGLLTMTLWVPPSRLRDPADLPAYERRLLAELAAIPGVESAATVNKLPIGGGDTGTPVSDGRELVSEANIRSVSAGYFATMRLRLEAGRFFSTEDTAATTPVVLVNETLARQAFPRGDALGRRIGFVFLAGKQLEIVGVVADENVTGPDAPTTPVIYFPSSQDPSASFEVIVRTGVEPESMAGAVLARLSAFDRAAVAGPAESLSRRLSDSPAVFLRRYPAGLIGGFGAAGLVLAAIGVFGVAARDVTRRTREIGIRMALGAAPADIVGLILANGSLPVAVGLAAGAAGSLAASRLLSSLLFGISPDNVTTVLAAGAVLAAVAAAASIAPALRAARADPSRALRAE